MEGSRLEAGTRHVIPSWMLAVADGLEAARGVGVLSAAGGRERAWVAAWSVGRVLVRRKHTARPLAGGWAARARRILEASAVRRPPASRSIGDCFQGRVTLGDL